MSLEITGKIYRKYDIQQVSDKFKKRDFIVELSEDINGKTYTNYAKMQLVQAKCEIIDRMNVGDEVKVSFSIKGNKWERDGKEQVITNLDAWRVEVLASAPVKLNVPESHFNAPPQVTTFELKHTSDDDGLPF